MSSASLIGSYNGTSSAATLIAICLVRAAMAEARINGDGRYPSSDMWCSETATAVNPWSSLHAAMSSAAA